MSEFFSRARFERDHRWATRQMSAYLDGELAASSRARMQHHAEACPECRRVLDGLRRMLGVLKGLSPPSGRADALAFAATVRARLDERPAS
jgi:anti-sigma factor RsiW